VSRPQFRSRSGSELGSHPASQLGLRPASQLGLRLDATVAARDFDVSLDVPHGQTVAVLGPNGAGKSTLLSVIAGLLRPDTGRVVVDDDVLVDEAVWVPPYRRGISLLAQDPLLFPHLTALDNVAFGPRSAGQKTPEARAIARGWLAEVECEDLAARRPARLSGGQSQRVAIARALASDPRILLLDEPLAALDVAVAPTIRRMLRRVLEGRTAVLVTHEVLDGLTLADRVIVLNRGRVVEQGATSEVLERPRHPFTAELAGLNLLTGTPTPGGLITDEGFRVIGTRRSAADARGGAGDGAHDGAGDGARDGARLGAAVRPSAVEAYKNRPESPNVVRVIVRDLEPRGDLIRVRTETLSADVTPGRAAALDVTPGAPLWFAFPASAVAVYPL
jgi:molybdate transport system ATP-binding protein